MSKGAELVSRAARPPARSDVTPSRASSTSLPTSERVFFEGRLGHDFSQVRLHTDERAAGAAAALSAKAFTIGHDISFANGRYSPGTSAGRRLLAHELVHVAQQTRTGAGTHASVEARADLAAARVVVGEPASPSLQGAAQPGLYCDADDDRKKPVDAPLAQRPPAVPLRNLRPGGDGTGGPSPFAAHQLGPSLPPYRLMANAEILASFSAYATTPATSGMDIRGDWAWAYFTFRNYMPESLAVTSANMFLPAAYRSKFAFNQPSQFDQSDREFKAAHPEEKHLPPIPLVSSGLLTQLYEAITKKKNTNAFYF